MGTPKIKPAKVISPSHGNWADGAAKEAYSAPHLNELTQVGQARLFSIWNFPDEDENAVDDGLLVLKAAVLAQHAGQEVHEGTILLGELEAQGPDGLHYHNLELVCDICHEGANL